MNVNHKDGLLPSLDSVALASNKAMGDGGEPQGTIFDEHSGKR